MHVHEFSILCSYMFIKNIVIQYMSSLQFHKKHIVVEACKHVHQEVVVLPDELTQSIIVVQVVDTHFSKSARCSHQGNPAEPHASTHA